ncbi:MAG: penicillin-binding protein activator [Pseudomonadota bacterium]
MLFTVCLLGSCGGGGNAYHLPWENYRLPWESAPDFSGGVNNPSGAPDIGWQTPGQRHVLTKQEDVLSPQQPAPEGQERPGAMFAPPVFGAADAPLADKGVTVSLLLPLSGKKAELGNSMLKAAQMALFDVGSAGFKMIPRDTRSTAEGAAAAAKAAVRNHDDLILGPVFADDLKAVKPVVSASGTPVISFTTDWTLADGNTYIMGFLPFTQVARVTRYAQSRGYSKLSVYAPQTEYCDVVIRTLQRTGVPIAHVGRYPSGQTDLLALVQEFAAAGRNSSSPNQLGFDMLMLPPRQRRAADFGHDPRNQRHRPDQGEIPRHGPVGRCGIDERSRPVRRMVRRPGSRPARGFREALSGELRCAAAAPFLPGL